MTFNTESRGVSKLIKTAVSIGKDDEFHVNDIVKHKLYGKGSITHIQGLGENSKITIKFRGNLIKKFIKKYANLKKIIN